MVEATIVVPVLIIVLIGAIYMRELYVARGAVRMTARQCAWDYARRGCDGGTSDACAGPAEPMPGLPRIAQIAIQTGDGVDPFSDVPVLGEAFQALFGTSTRATATAQVPFPFDPERAGFARGEMVLLCNSERIEVLDLAKEWLCDRLGCQL